MNSSQILYEIDQLDGIFRLIPNLAGVRMIPEKL